MKWPVIVLFVVLIVAILYYTTPNVKQPKFRWLVRRRGCRDRGVDRRLGRVRVLRLDVRELRQDLRLARRRGHGLLWLWITNLALLFGAELDSELERGRQLQAGIAAEEELQLPARDTRGITKARKKEQKDLARGRAIREEADESITTDTREKTP